MTDDNIRVLPNRGSKNFLPPTTRVLRIHCCAPVVISPVDEIRTIPEGTFRFDPPATEEQAFEFINKIRDGGGMMFRRPEGEGIWIFIPWPCAAIYFETVDLAAGDSQA